jgi:hypothetical protein
MKTIKLFFTVILGVLSVNTSMAQSNERISVEKEHKGETYIVDSFPPNNLRGSANSYYRSQSIVNKNKEVISHSTISYCLNLKETTPLVDVFKNAISKEKMKSLAYKDQRNMILITFFYDTETGQVVYMWFHLQGVSLSEAEDSDTNITLEDINSLEKHFKEYYFDVSKAFCQEIKGEKIKYGKYMYAFWFSKLAEEEDKE